MTIINCLLHALFHLQRWSGMRRTSADTWSLSGQIYPVSSSLASRMRAWLRYNLIFCTESIVSGSRCIPKTFSALRLLTLPVYWREKKTMYLLSSYIILCPKVSICVILCIQSGFWSKYFAIKRCWIALLASVHDQSLRNVREQEKVQPLSEGSFIFYRVILFLRCQNSRWPSHSDWIHSYQQLISSDHEFMK
jgi:hypothetical protein